MIQCLLHAVDLGPEYWLFALLQAAFVKNRTPHSFIHKTLFEVITGSEPGLANLGTFGCRTFAKKPDKRPDKLDNHTTNSIF